MTNVLSNNPFRTPQLSPQNTNASVNLRAGVVDTPTSSGITQNNNLFDSIPDEPPPPYTLSVDDHTLEEETPIGLGHSSQPVQEPSLPDLPPRIQTLNNSVPANIVQPSIRINNNQFEPSEVRNPQQPPPPPRHPTTTISTTNTNTNRRSASVSSPTSPVVNVSPVRSRSDRLSMSYLPPPGPPPGSFSSEGRSQIFDPPNGPPPRRAVSSSASSSNRLSDNNNNITRPIDDGRPTTTPVPGHPLLFQNKLLVYPSGYECSQCKNVGYRNNDPSHPCMKCWNKYARSYSGALAYAPFPSSSPNGVSSSSSSSSSNFQRPLPRLQPPHGSGASSSSRPARQKPPPPQQGQARLRRRSQSESKLNGGNNNNNINITSPSMSSLSPASPRISASNNTSPRTTSVPHSPVTQRPINHTNRIPAYSSSQLRTPAPQSPPTQRPVLANRQSCISTRPPPTPQSPSLPGGGRTTIYQAGDPRLGGRLCWRCDGRGRISYFLFDSTTCEICGGIGRTFN